MSETMAGLTEVFRDVFDDSALTIAPATTAQDIPEWTSVLHVHLVLAVEQHFGVRFRTDEIEGLRNVGDFVGLIEKKQAAG